MGAQAVRLSNVDIDNALKNKDFEVLFQPIFDLGNGALARMETFVRWRHPSLGLLPPGAFISFFETQGRMSELTRYVLAQTLDAYLEWRGPYAPGFSINLALTDLSDEGFASHFTKLLRDKNFPAELITLECPMPPVDLPLDVATSHFEKLQETGARLAIEVRGRANDLLRNIDPFPFDEIKTGGSSILRFARTVRGPGLSAISDLLEIASKSNAVITAVGVEDQASLSALRGLGFTAAQGNHLAKVGSLNDFRPHHVNEVRERLELDALDSESLQALFRTDGPHPSQAPTTNVDAENENIDESADEASNEQEATASDDQLVDRLNQRLAKQKTPETAPTKKTAAPTTEVAHDDTEAAAKKKALAREKAKAVILAKRAKAREMRKAAAIDRAKAKVAYQKKKAAQQEASGAAAAQKQPEFPPVDAPRALQERISREFGDMKPSESGPRGQSKEQSETKSVNSDKKDQSGSTPATDEVAPLAASLQIGDANARFQPGIHVGNAGLAGPRAQTIRRVTPSSSATASSAPQSTAPKSNAVPEADPTPTPPANIEITETHAPESPPDADEPQAQIADDTLAEDRGDVIQGDLDDTSPVTMRESLNVSDKQSAGRRRKPFLKRTIIPYPTYFWPKSWKRKWLQMKAGAAQD